MSHLLQPLTTSPLTFPVPQCTVQQCPLTGRPVCAAGTAAGDQDSPELAHHHYGPLLWMVRHHRCFTERWPASHVHLDCEGWSYPGHTPQTGSVLLPFFHLHCSEIEQIPPSSPSETMWASTIAGSDCGVPTCEAAPKTIHSSYAPAAVVQAARHQVTACQDTTNNNLERRKNCHMRKSKTEKCGIGSVTNRAHWKKSSQIRKTKNLAQNPPRTKSKLWVVSEAIED